MKIAIEAQRIFRKNKHGMDFVALEVIRQLQKKDLQNEYYILVAPGEDHCLHSTANFHILEIKCPGGYPAWEQIALPRAVRKIKPALLHCTSNTAPLYCPVPLVLTLHDIIFLERKTGKNHSLYQNLGWYYRRFIVPRILPKCKKIFTVSDFECNRIRQSLGLNEEQIMTVHNGYSERFRPMENTESITRKYLPERNYIFFLGSTDPKKNTPATLKAYAIYHRQSRRPLPLLIADLDEKEINRILNTEKIQDIKPSLYYPGYITHADLPAIYNGASVFLYTSLRESFGIPLLEAMACGTPVISSTTSAIPEIAGQGATLINPTEPEAIASALFRLEEDQTYRNQQISYGLERVKLFSWANTAQKLFDIYTQLTN